tara:strand:- start:885 stop:1835 length:951 start_codon:yes stop_codon:yes gene_type:complete
MKKITLILIVFILNNLSIAQDAPLFEIDFEGGHVHGYNDSAIWHLEIDTISNPNNIWQIGSPLKSTFISANSVPNVIVTDRINSYPINDTSSFTVKYVISGVSLTLSLYMQGYYFVDSDTLSDYGIIEFSPDNGVSWIDLLNSSTYRNEIYFDGRPLSSGNAQVPILSGRSDGWTPFSIDIRELGMALNLQSGDTTLWRFSFISDSNNSNRDGLMYDNLYFENANPIGVDEHEQISNIPSRVFPNPAETTITIELENDNMTDFDLTIYNVSGQIVHQAIVQREHEVNVSEFPKGVFTYIIHSQDAIFRSSGSFVKH